MLQYRNKTGSARIRLRDAARIREIFKRNSDVRLIFNDRPDLAVLAGFDGVHVGQGDVAPEDARRIVGSSRWIGVSTHSVEQVQQASHTDCDYIAYGPIFSTASKANPDPTVGLTGLKTVRALTSKPIVAIGGITKRNARSVLDAGADSLAIISDLLPDGSSIDSSEASARKIVDEFLAVLA